MSLNTNPVLAPIAIDGPPLERKERCPRGLKAENWAHDFWAQIATDSGTYLTTSQWIIVCRKCGVRA